MPIATVQKITAKLPAVVLIDLSRLSFDGRHAGQTVPPQVVNKELV
jgi:hypothetical protein